MKQNVKGPLVSVFMPTYNHEAFIAESIESVLAQEYENMEIVIVDDASTDRTPDIIQEYDKKYPGLFKIKINQKNLGVTPTFNIILSMCTGKYIAVISGDDVWLPGKILKQVKRMEEETKCVLVYHDVEVFNSEDNRHIRYWNSGSGGAKAFEGNCLDVVKLLVERGTIFMEAVSVFVRRDRIPPWGFDNRVPIASDWLMWIDILARGPGTVRFIPEVLAKYRRHNNNITNTEYETDVFVTLAIVESRYPMLAKAVLSYRGYYLYYLRGLNQLQQGKVKTACNLLFLALLQSRRTWKWILWGIITYLPRRVMNSFFQRKT